MDDKWWMYLRKQNTIRTTLQLRPALDRKFLGCLPATMRGRLHLASPEVLHPAFRDPVLRGTTSLLTCLILNACSKMSKLAKHMPIVTILCIMCWITCIVNPSWICYTSSRRSSPPTLDARRWLCCSSSAPLCNSPPIDFLMDVWNAEVCVLIERVDQDEDN